MYKNDDKFNGIINYLTNKTGGNIHDNETIEVTSNEYSLHPKNILDQSNSNYFEARFKDKYATICFDFKNMQIEIEKYSIKSTNCDAGLGHIKNWVLEVSNDKNKWIKIDEQTNYSELNGPDKIKTFKVQPNSYSRYCRIRHTGDYWGINNGMHFQICAMEFYGKLKTPKKYNLHIH